MVFLKDDQLMEITEILKKVFYLIDEEKYDELANYEMDELLNRQLVSEDIFKRNKQKLHFDKVNCRSVESCSTKIVNDKTIYVISVKMTFERYITDEKGDIIYGTKDYIVDAKYDVSVIENVNDNSNIRCPSCDALIDENSNMCSYCGTLIKKKTSKWLVCDIVEKEVEDTLKKLLEENDKRNMEESKNLYSRIIAEEEERRALR